MFDNQGAIKETHNQREECETLRKIIKIGRKNLFEKRDSITPSIPFPNNHHQHSAMFREKSKTESVRLSLTRNRGRRLSRTENLN